MTENDKTLVAWLYLEAAGAEDKGTENILNEIAARIEALSAENERLRKALREVFEEWAGSEGFIPETAPEGYLLQLTKRMADIARAALGETK